MERGIFTYVALALLVWAISVTIVASYYFTKYNTYQNEYRNLTEEINTLSNAVVNISETFSASINDLSESFTGDFHSLSGTMGNLSQILESISLKVNILLGHGNTTRTYYNGTTLPLGSTAFTAILAAADIKYEDYGGELGILITSINGVPNNSTHGWFYWYWDNEQSQWILPEYSCDKHILHRNDTIAWIYANFMEWPPPPPT